MTPSNGGPLDRIRRGGSSYVAHLRLFSRNVWLVLLASMGTGFAFGVFLFIFNFYVLSLGPSYNEAFLGTLTSAASFATIAMAIPSAWIAQRFPTKWVLVSGGVIGVVAYLGIVLFPVREALIGFRMLAGIAMSISAVAAAPFLMANTGAADRQWAFSFQAGLSTVASFFGNLLAGILPGRMAAIFDVGPMDTLAYQSSLASMVVVSALALVPLLLIGQSKNQTIATELPWTQLRRYWRMFAIILLPSLLIGLGAGLMQPFMNVYFRNVYLKPDAAIGIVFALGGLAMAVGQFVGPPLADRMGKIRAVMLTQALSIPFLMTLGLGAWLVPAGIVRAEVFFIAAGIAYIFRLALMNLSNPIYSTFILERVPEQAQALSISLTNLVFQVGWFVMPQVSGRLQVQHGPSGFAYVFAGVTGFYMAAILVEKWFFGGDARAERQLRAAEGVAGA